MPDRLFDLLPAIYRVRDREAGGALQGLLSVAEGTLEDLEEDIRRLYDDLFIETCEDWVVPYLGDLLGVPLLHSGRLDAVTLRTLVARTIGYRRQKGTTAVLGRIVRDLTGFEPVVREGITLVGWNQHVNHVRPERKATPDLRDRELLKDLGSPNDRVLRTVSIRSEGAGAVRTNPAGVDIVMSPRAETEATGLLHCLTEYLPAGVQARIHVP